MRLLTEEEIVKEASKDSTYCQLSVDIGLWASKKQDKETLKAVGEWLKSKWTVGYMAIDVSLEDVEILRRGEMPEEAQVKSEMGFTEGELKDLRHNASDDTIG